MTNITYVLPVLLVVGVIFVWMMSRRFRNRHPAGPQDGTGGRPDETEPRELRGEEQHRRREPR